MIQVPDGRGGTRMMTRESAAKMLGIPPAPQAPSGATVPAPASEVPAPAPEASSGRLTVVAPDDKTAERWMRQFESQGIPATVKVAPKARKGNPAPITEPISAPPIRTAGGPPRTDELLGYTPPKPPEPTGGQTAVDKKFADEYVQFKAAGGYADVKKQLATLRDATKALESDSSLTGPVRGLLPDTVRAVTNPLAVSTKDKVQEVVQRNLRLVLGAQFTEKEGERLVSRAYNPQLSTAENKIRVDRIIEQIDAAARAKQEAADYYEKHGTLTGWQGKLLTIDDIGAGITDSPEAAPRQPAPTKSLMLGQVVNGFRYSGGDPNDPKSWRPVGGGSGSF
jgi:hypothetical protein